MVTVWYLIAILITPNGDVVSQKLSTHEDIVECFDYRSLGLIQNDLYTPGDYARAGMQFVCVAKVEDAK